MKNESKKFQTIRELSSSYPNPKNTGGGGENYAKKEAHEDRVLKRASEKIFGNRSGFSTGAVLVAIVIAYTILGIYSGTIPTSADESRAFGNIRGEDELAATKIRLARRRDEIKAGSSGEQSEPENSEQQAGGAEQPRDQSVGTCGDISDGRRHLGIWGISRYYTVVKGQSRYYNGSYASDFYINCQGDCLKTADGFDLSAAPAFSVIACPPTYALGSRFCIDGIGEVTCHDRGGAIKGKRIDLWSGIGDEGLDNIYSGFGAGKHNVYLLD